jgi:hypothetical protein
MMSFESLELCNHHSAGRDQCVTVLVGKGARPERLGEARIGKSFLVRIAGSSDDHAVDHLAGVLDAIGCDATALRVAQKEAGGLCQSSRVGGFGNASPQQQGQGDRNG